MTNRPWALLRRGLNSSLLRFLLVGGSGELLYLALFALAVRSGLSSLVAISLAGGICLVINALLHARISFRVRFSRSLLASYGAIQLLCLAVSLGAGALLERLGATATVVGVVTMVLWAGLSFVLTKTTYRRSGGATGLASRHTNQRP
jgi:putative flippase GtrA